MNGSEDTKLAQALAAFDALNAQDPNTIQVEGQAQPKELHDALAMTRWVDALYPQAGEAVRLAARCQHLCRWQSPRSNYPEGRAGYLRWRTELKKFHAEKAAEVLRTVGYDESVIEAVRAINLKQGLKSNPDVQMVEDALCLVFLETQFEGYLDQWEKEKVIGILRKTWGKMSVAGHQAALQLSMSERARSLIEAALADD